MGSDNSKPVAPTTSTTILPTISVSSGNNDNNNNSVMITPFTTILQLASRFQKNQSVAVYGADLLKDEDEKSGPHKSTGPMKLEFDHRINNEPNLKEKQDKYSLHGNSADDQKSASTSSTTNISTGSSAQPDDVNFNFWLCRVEDKRKVKVVLIDDEEQKRKEIEVEDSLFNCYGSDSKSGLLYFWLLQDYNSVYRVKPFTEKQSSSTSFDFPLPPRLYETGIHEYNVATKEENMYNKYGMKVMNDFLMK
jgi:hypothetical protein